MNDLINVVDWSRAQFALTAIYHWLFVPLTLGLSVIVAIMETIYIRTKDKKWLGITKFWMLLFGINFAIGVATGIILEFEFGTNWSNYSWFVGDIFGAPLAIEGLLAFFMESTFIAVMFFGWKKVSPGFHLAATWLTAIGASLSALWILVANAWMQYPVGMQFDPAQMRNVMDSFADVALSPVAINKFFHTVLSGWALAAVFVIGVSGWLLLKKRNTDMAIKSIKVASWVGIIGILLTIHFGDGSAKAVYKVQPMKLAAMEGLYRGQCGQKIIAWGFLNPQKEYNNNEKELIFDISIPKGLSWLATGNPDAFVPGINDLIDGIELTANGDTIYNISYAERIERGKIAHNALRLYDKAQIEGNKELLDSANNVLQANYNYFGYGYFDDVSEAIPDTCLVFYSFHIMVIIGGYLLFFFIIVAIMAFKGTVLQKSKLMQWIAILSIPAVWICSECGWITAELGRQPWVIEGLMPTRAAISDVSSTSVQITFFLFAIIFTGLLIAEVSIMLHQIKNKSLTDIQNEH
ncbi:MAG: cytochrome ubiquinol oxidase subunit I [Muribaculaceae bacterium]|nr:cytochrome ubiquinol oxidase subunit I [Muribaculaceae bacterium]